MNEPIKARCAAEERQGKLCLMVNRFGRRKIWLKPKLAGAAEKRVTIISSVSYYTMKSLALLVLSVYLVSCAVVPQDILRSHAYKGDMRPESEVATVYASLGDVTGNPPRGATYMFRIDGKLWTFIGKITSWLSVAYLLPGVHEFQVKWWAGMNSFYGTYYWTVEAGKVYEVVARHDDVPLAHASSLGFELVEKPADFELTYKEVAPHFFKDGKLEDFPVDPATAKTH